jgi:hypothetical protein
MAYGDYLTPSHSAVYINEWHVEDCYDVRWQTEDTTSPSFDYMRREYQAISPGKVLVSGSLAINFRYPGYLTNALIDHSKKNAVGTPAELRFSKELSSWISDMVQGTKADKFKLLVEAAAKGQTFLDRVAVASSAMLSLPPSGDFARRGTEVKLPYDYQNSDPLGQIKPIDIWIFYGDPQDQFVADKLSGVVFVGQSKTLSAGASTGGGVSSSGTPIMEIYPFFAKNVTQWEMDSFGKWVQEKK